MKVKDFETFVREVESKASRRRPVRTGVSGMSGKMDWKRNVRLSIREAVLRGVTVVLLYRKVTDNQVKRYEVIPTQYKMLRSKSGAFRKVLWVQDVRDGPGKRQIKSFYLRNILKVALTDRRLKSRWPILIR